MFKKKKEDDWYIEGYGDEEIEEKPKKSKWKREKKKKEENEGEMIEGMPENSMDTLDSWDLQSYKQQPNSLRKREESASYVDSFGDYVIEEDTKPIAKWKIYTPLFIVCVLVIGGIGWFNTDFDEVGHAYYVPLQQHYERKYIVQADEVFQYILDMNQTLDMDTAYLPQEYVVNSTKLTEELNTLKTMTTELSKYVGVPNELVTYHNQLISFSLSTQTFINKLLKNYNDVNYESFRQAGLSDYYNSLKSLKMAREQIDGILFSNMQEGDN